MVQRLIMICLDGGKQAQHALDWYIANMNKPGDHVLLFHCSQFELHIGLPGLAVNVEHVSKQVKEAKEHSDEVIRNANELLRQKSIQAYSIVRQNSKPHEAILDVAKEEKVTHIITGTRDQGSVKRALIGSVSTEIVRHAHVPVTVVH